MTVGFVSPGWPPGGEHSNGIVSYVGSIREGMLTCGAGVRVLTSNPASECRPEYVCRIRHWRERHGRLVQLALCAGYRLLPSLLHRRLCADSILDAIDRIRSRDHLDIVEIEESFGVAGLVAPRSPVPVVVRLHGPWMVVGRALGKQADADFTQRVRLEGQTISSVAGISAPSHDILRRVREHYGVGLPEAEVIPNSIAPVPKADRWTLDQSDRDTILFVGRFDRVKGGDVAIEAFVRLAGRHPKVRLLFVGPDHGCVDLQGRRWTLPQYLHERVLDPGVRARIDCQGARSAREIALMRRRCFATIVCSRYENFPMVLLEAMAAGCPIVVSAVGGMQEIIQHDRNGLQCQPEDADDCAAQMLCLLRDPGHAARLGRQAAIDAEVRYHPEKVARATLDFYSRVLERWSRGER